MAADRRPGNLAHLERLINAWSRDDTDGQATAGRLRRLVAISVLATILDGLDQGGAPRLAFKGGASMEIRFGVTARASRDVDALVNDIYDILLLAGTVESEGLAHTRAACEDTFTHRGKHAWPPTVPAWADWEQLWNALGVPDDARYSYMDARQRFEQLIRQIAEALQTISVTREVRADPNR